MEKKNTVLLTVIAVATLLVAVVGATFAYFTATGTASGSAGTTEATTPTVADSAELTTVTSKKEDAYYPGQINYVAAVVSANKTGTVTAADKKMAVSYSITGSVTIPTELGSDATVKVYKVTGTAVETPVSGCGTQYEHTDGTGTKYYVEGCTVADFTDAEELTVNDGAFSDTGVLKTAADATTGGESVQYVAVVTYANNGNQNAQQGQTITATINAATVTGTATAAA